MAVTEKISLTIGRDELKRARSAAHRYGLSLSAFVTAAVRERIEEQERRQVGEKLLASFSSEERASPEERRELLALWSQPAPTPRRARRAKKH